MKSKKFMNANAFTLAEVLITLGIIGVVAAMTMPTLLNSTQGAQYKTAYKKALSVLSQAVVLNIALDDYGLADTTVTSTDGTSPSMYNLFKNRMNVVKTTTSTYSISGFEPSSSNYNFFFNDGISLSFPDTAKGCTEASPCKGFIDVNGEKAPNKKVTCDGNTKDDNCVVSNPTDVYPVIMYDQSILPNSDAAKAVLFGK